MRKVLLVHISSSGCCNTLVTMLNNGDFGFPYCAPAFSTPAVWCRVFQSRVFSRSPETRLYPLPRPESPWPGDRGLRPTSYPTTVSGFAHGFRRRSDWLQNTAMHQLQTLERDVRLNRPPRVPQTHRQLASVAGVNWRHWSSTGVKWAAVTANEYRSVAGRALSV